MKLVLATRNPGKISELTHMLRRFSTPPFEVVSLENDPDAPEVVEDGKTYTQNAVKKATLIAHYTSELTLADDTGLEVAALNGAPGIHAKRWAGPDATDACRIAKLLHQLEGTSHRHARFIAAVAVVHPNAEPKTSLGICDGHITHEPRGDKGFGYDPVFVPNGYPQTFAELGEDLKNRISHRAKALLKLLTQYPAARWAHGDPSQAHAPTAGGQDENG